MKHLFVPYEMALSAKQKGFNEEGLAFYSAIVEENHQFVWCNKNESIRNSYAPNTVSAPTYQQVIDWLREEHKLHICIYPIKTLWEGDVRYHNGVHNESPVSFKDCATFEEVRLKAITEAIKLI